MKTFIFILIVLIAVLQYKLWAEEGGLVSAWRLQKTVQAQNDENTRLKQRNQILEAQVKELKTGQEAIEEIARNELGMIKKGESYYQIVEER